MNYFAFPLHAEFVPPNFAYRMHLRKIGAEVPRVANSSIKESIIKVGMFMSPLCFKYHIFYRPVAGIAGPNAEEAA